MSKFKMTDTFTMEFEGDKVTATLAKLKRKDYLKLMPYVKIDDDGKVKMSFEEEQEFLDVASDLLPAYVKTFGGLVDSDELGIDITTVVEHVYFLQITSELVGALMVNSGLQDDEKEKGEDLKNLEGQPDTDTTG